MSNQEVFPVEIYSCIISNISPTLMSSIVEHSRAALGRSSHSPLMVSQNRSDLLALSLVSKSWSDICRCVFGSLIFTDAPDDTETRKQFIQLVQHPLCTFKKHVEALVLHDPPPDSTVAPFATEFLTCLAFLPETKAVSLRNVDFRKCSKEQWDHLSTLIFTPEQQTLVFLRCSFPHPDLLAASLARCSKLYSLSITAWDDPLVFGQAPETIDVTTFSSSLGPSLKDLNISTLYPAFPGASTTQTMNTYLYHLSRSTEKLQLVNFHCHAALERQGEAQEGLDVLVNFIDQRIDQSCLRLLNVNLLIFDDAGVSFDKIGKSVSALCSLTYVMLTLPPFMEDTEGPGARAKAFIMVLLESISSPRLETIFFMVGSVSEVKDLAFLDWESVGKALLRPNYANLGSVVLDCTGNMMANEWAEEAIPWLNAHVRKLIPPHIQLNVGGIGPAGLVTLSSPRSTFGLQTFSSKVRAFRDTLVSYLPF